MINIRLLLGILLLAGLRFFSDDTRIGASAVLKVPATSGFAAVFALRLLGNHALVSGAISELCAFSLSQLTLVEIVLGLSLEIATDTVLQRLEIVQKMFDNVVEVLSLVEEFLRFWLRHQFMSRRPQARIFLQANLDELAELVRPVFVLG